MKALTMILKQKLTLTLLSVLVVAINPAMANVDKDAMGEVQKARANSRNKDHAEHTKTVDESQKFRGVYYGYLPCKDCAGIKMTLSLKNKQNYLLVTQFAQASSREYYEKGKYTWDDKSGIVTLVSRKDGSIQKLRIKDAGALIMLNPDGEAMQGDQDKYTLVNSENSKSREVHIH